MRNTDLHVACDSEAPIGTDMQFRANRLSDPPSAHWVLCLETDRSAIHLRHVAPSPLRVVLDRDGVLGLVFPSTVAAVNLSVAAGELGMSEWRFWVDDDELDGPQPGTGGA